MKRQALQAAALGDLVERMQILPPQGEQTICVSATNAHYKTPHGWRVVLH